MHSLQLTSTLSCEKNLSYFSKSKTLPTYSLRLICTLCVQKFHASSRTHSMHSICTPCITYRRETIETYSILHKFIHSPWTSYIHKIHNNSKLVNNINIVQLYQLPMFYSFQKTWLHLYLLQSLQLENFSNDPELPHSSSSYLNSITFYCSGYLLSLINAT